MQQTNLYIIVEGKSESIFMRRLLAHYLYQKSDSRFIVHVIQNETSSGYYGGVVNYAKLVRNIIGQLNKHPYSYVTTFIDFYGLASVDFPFYESVMTHSSDPYRRVSHLEDILAHAVGNHERFIPYIQLYEFEALYFADHERFLTIDTGWSRHQKSRIMQIVKKYHNPELINNSYKTAPSKRLHKILGYNKVRDTDLYQRMFRHKSKSVISQMRDRCPHFNQWIKKLLAVSHQT